MSAESNRFDDLYDELDNESPEDGIICEECGEWVLVYTNASSRGLLYCPCCGEKWNWEELHGK